MMQYRDKVFRSSWSSLGDLLIRATSSANRSIMIVIVKSEEGGSPRELISLDSRSISTRKRDGLMREPCLTPFSIRNHLEYLL